MEDANVAASTAAVAWREEDSDLFEAAMTGDVARAEDAIARGGNIHYSNVAGVTPLIVACGGVGPLALIEKLLDWGASVNAVDNTGWSSLHYVASSGQAHLLVPLLTAGADINVAVSDQGWTPLTRAAYRGHLEAVQILCSAGADVLLCTQGKLAHTIAIECGHETVHAYLSPLIAARTPGMVVTSL